MARELTEERLPSISPGTKLRCIDSSDREDYLTQGEIYTFKEIHPMLDNEIRLEETGKLSHMCGRFVLVRDSSPVKRETNLKGAK